LTKLKVNEELPFARSESKYEPDAIGIETVDGIKVGYDPEADAILFLRLMEAGKFLFAKVKSISFSKTLPIIKIDIYRRDF